MISPDLEAQIKNLIDRNRSQVDAEAITAIGHVIFGHFGKDNLENADELAEMVGIASKFYFRDLDIRDVELLQGITFKAGIQLTEILERIRDLHRHLKSKEVKVNEPVSTGEEHGPETPPTAA